MQMASQSWTLIAISNSAVLTLAIVYSIYKAFIRSLLPLSLKSFVLFYIHEHILSFVASSNNQITTQFCLDVRKPSSQK